MSHAGLQGFKLVIEQKFSEIREHLEGCGFRVCCVVKAQLHGIDEVVQGSRVQTNKLGELECSQGARRLGFKLDLKLDPEPRLNSLKQSPLMRLLPMKRLLKLSGIAPEHHLVAHHDLTSRPHQKPQNLPARLKDLLVLLGACLAQHWVVGLETDHNRPWLGLSGHELEGCEFGRRVTQKVKGAEVQAGGGRWVSQVALDCFEVGENGLGGDW